MGGKVLELESEKQARLLREGIERSRAEGRAEASLQGLQALVNTLKNFCDTPDEICKNVWSNQMYAGVTREEIERFL